MFLVLSIINKFYYYIISVTSVFLYCNFPSPSFLIITILINFAVFPFFFAMLIFGFLVYFVDIWTKILHVQNTVFYYSVQNKLEIFVHSSFNQLNQKLTKYSFVSIRSGFIILHLKIISNKQRSRMVGFKNCILSSLSNIKTVWKNINKVTFSLKKIKNVGIYLNLFNLLTSKYH